MRDKLYTHTKRNVFEKTLDIVPHKSYNTKAVPRSGVKPEDLTVKKFKKIFKNPLTKPSVCGMIDERPKKGSKNSALAP